MKKRSKILPVINYTIDERLSVEESELIDKRLDTYNERQIGFLDKRPLNLAARDSEGTLLGGLIGSTSFQWLYIHDLWIEKQHRNCGIGSSLLDYAERQGIDRGCHSSWLVTFSFQARGFYEKSGYVVFAQLDDYPEGCIMYFMRKKLTLEKN